MTFYNLSMSRHTATNPDTVANFDLGPVHNKTGGPNKSDCETNSSSSRIYAYFNALQICRRFLISQ